MSRPTTPLGLSPRGSYVNIHSAMLESPSEKERVKAEFSVQAALLKLEDGLERAKKEETGMPAGSPSEHDFLTLSWRRILKPELTSQSGQFSATAWHRS